MITATNTDTFIAAHHKDIHFPGLYKCTTDHTKYLYIVKCITLTYKYSINLEDGVITQVAPREQGLYEGFASGLTYTPTRDKLTIQGDFP